MLHTSIRPVLLIVALTALPAIAVAELSSVPGAFADIGLGASIMGMSGTAAAGTGQIDDLFWNPAGLSALPRRSVSAMQTEQFGLVPTYMIAGGLPLGGGRSLAVGIVSSGDALLRENSLVCGLSADLPGRRWGSVGLALKVRHASFGRGAEADAVKGDAIGAALDLGFRLKRGPLAFGIFMEEVVGTLKWNSSVQGRYYEDVPPTLSCGLAWEETAFRLAADLQPALGEERLGRLAFGAEWNILSILAIRGGVQQELSADGRRDLSLGAGLGKTMPDESSIRIDSAYLFNELGGSLRVSLSFAY